ncbi:hypothetical protein DPMN_096928 [Dreissena polymorpha]|uniref:Uncharacterized protein n=1 Tax=Dreissena polymorpha TaxID=45954 RepID=A0A9D4R578_DREPO|nr:hypothetical protein DPMN_096928 [Dreissena polymorpha]
MSNMSSGPGGKFMERQLIERQNLSSKNFRSLGSHVFERTVTIFELSRAIIRTNLRTKFHEDWTINVTSRVLTRKTAPSPGGHIFQQTEPIFKPNRNSKLSRAIIRKNVLNNSHVDLAINVTAIVLTRKTAPPLGGHVFQRTGIFSNSDELSIEIKYWTVNVTSRVLTRKTAPSPGDWTIHVTSRVLTSKTAPHPCSHVSQQTGTILELSREIIKKNALTKFQDDWTKQRFQDHKTAPPAGGHFHEDWTINITHVVTMLMTKFHEDQTINVTSRVLTRQNVDDGRRTTDKR